MWAHWAFKKAPSEYLEQGDVLRASSEVKALLATYHPHYAAHPDNRFYIVLSQSCDLVRRGGDIKARYISIAPVRTLDAILQREFSSSISWLDDGDGFASSRVKAEVEKFLTRLINNNEPGYFYIEPEAAAGLTEPMCASLGLAISFRAEHYDKFLEARTISLEDSFQAKLGWLLGQMYSRVGTQDFPVEQLRQKIDDIVSSLALWLEQPQFDHVRKQMVSEKEAQPERRFDMDDVRRISTTLISKKEQAIEILLNLVAEQGLAANPSPARRNLRLSLQSDAAFAQLFR